MDGFDIIERTGKVLKMASETGLYDQLMELKDKYFELQQLNDRLYQENKKLKEELSRRNEGPLDPTEIIDAYDYDL